MPGATVHREQPGKSRARACAERLGMEQCAVSRRIRGVGVACRNEARGGRRGGLRLRTPQGQSGFGARTCSPQRWTMAPGRVRALARVRTLLRVRNPRAGTVSVVTFPRFLGST